MRNIRTILVDLAKELLYIEQLNVCVVKGGNTLKAGVVVVFLPLEAGGNSPITVLSPMEEMSLSCSLSDSMLVHRVSTIVSTWYSFTLLTSGPRLSKTNAPAVIRRTVTESKDTPVKLKRTGVFLPFDSQVLNLSVFVFQQLENHPHHLSNNT